MDWLLIALVFILGSLAIAVVAVFVIIKQNRIQRAQPEVTIEATFLKATSETSMMNENFTSGTVDSGSAYESKQYYAEFQLPQRKKLKFKVKKRIALSLSDGTKGILKYKGYKFISFMPTGKEAVK